MCDQETLPDPLARVPEKRPGLIVFDDIRRYSRQDVVELRYHLPGLVVRLTAKERSVSPAAVLRALDAYLEDAEGNEAELNTARPSLPVPPPAGPLAAHSAHISDPDGLLMQ